MNLKPPPSPSSTTPQKKRLSICRLTYRSFALKEGGGGTEGSPRAGASCYLAWVSPPPAARASPLFLPSSPASLSSWGPIGRRRCLCATAPPAPRRRGGHGVIQGQQVAKDIARALPRWRTGDPPPPPPLLHAARALLHAEREEGDRWAAAASEWEKYNSRRNEPDERLIGANNL